MKTHALPLFGLALAIVATACGDAPSDPLTSSSPPSSTRPPATTQPVPSDASNLVGTEWIIDGFVVGGLDFALVVDADPTIVFSADGPDVSGTTGCNSYFAAIEYGSAGEIVIGGVGQTEMACFPEEVMAQEQQFTQAMSLVRFYEIDGDRLTLASLDGDVIISGVSRDSVELPVELGDVIWVADTRIEGDAASTLVAGTDVTLRFDAALGNIGGNSGCNQFGATYVIDEARIRVDNIVGTERACEEPVMEQQRFVYEVLANATTFEIDRGRLTITTTDGRGIGLIAGDPK